MENPKHTILIVTRSLHIAVNVDDNEKMRKNSRSSKSVTLISAHPSTGLDAMSVGTWLNKYRSKWVINHNLITYWHLNSTPTGNTAPRRK